MLHIGIDFETHLISKDSPNPKPVCLSYYFVDSNQNIRQDILVKDEIESFLLKILSSSETRIIAHNATFELLVIHEHFPNLKSLVRNKLELGHIICTQIFQVLLDNVVVRKNASPNYSLKALIKYYYDVDMVKGGDSWQLRYQELEFIPKADWPKEAIEYSLADAKWCYKLFMEHQKQNLNITYAPSVEAAFYLNHAGTQGMTVDPNRVNTLEKEISNILKPHYQFLISKELVEFKKGKYKKALGKLRDLLAKNLDEKFLIFTPKGGLKLSEEALSTYIANAEGEIKAVLEAFLAIAEYEKIQTAFISRLSGAEIVRTTYNSVVRSGRTSSRTSDHYPSINIQQIPRKVNNVTYDIRNCFVPRGGYVICSIDYSGLELASCAHRLAIVTGENAMQHLLNAGTEPADLHSTLAAKIKSSTESTIITATDFLAHKKDKGYAEYRQLAKPINLGFPGGIGYDVMRTTLAKEGIYPKFKVLDSCKYEKPLQITARQLRKKGYAVRVRQVKWDLYQLVYDELVELKRQMFSLYPDLAAFLGEEHTKYLNGKTKKVKNEFGIWETEELYDLQVETFIRKNVTYTEFCNGMLMQSPSAIGAKKAFVGAAKEFFDHPEVRVLAFIHDEILFEIKNNENMVKNIARASEIMIDKMHEVLYSVRIAVEAEVANQWQKAGGFYSKTYWKDPYKKLLLSK